MHELTRSFEVRCHFGQAKGDGLVFDDCLAEGSALLRIEECNLMRSAGHAHGLRSDTDTTTLEVSKGNAVALTFGAEPAFFRHAKTIEVDFACVRRVLPILLSIRPTQ